MTRVLVCGGRHYDDTERVWGVLNSYDQDHNFTALIEGGARGADRAARDWARLAKIPVITFEADWKRHGKMAGPLRNARMITEGYPDLVIAFPGGRGTKNMTATARANGIEVIEVSP